MTRKTPTLPPKLADLNSMQAQSRLLKKPRHRFIDLFAGIGGFRIAFTAAGFDPVFSSEWDSMAQKTYSTNFGTVPAGDIRAVESKTIPEFEVLCAGFPCQPFSLAGVSKKNALGRPHGFNDQKQGNLFFEIMRIVNARKPQALLLENVKNLGSHDGGKTLQVIRDSLEAAGYHLKMAVINARVLVPQNRERIYIAGFRSKAAMESFRFPLLADKKPTLGKILENRVLPKYTLSDHLWRYLQDYKKKHEAAGHGFGFGLADRNGVTRTLSARYYKDGSEILVPMRGKNPRRLTPRECARLMGFPESFQIPVSDTQAYKQFGNSVVVPVVQAIAIEMKKALDTASARRKERNERGQPVSLSRG
ncbi:MAG: DNA (cytosine-5-)-methyltransferase [Leptospirales bacterium]|nr:DNA (cytosine-5-)-methyltransferase [Leptospirales bacterium]